MNILIKTNIPTATCTLSMIFSTFIRVAINPTTKGIFPVVMLNAPNQTIDKKPIKYKPNTVKTLITVFKNFHNLFNKIVNIKT